MNKKMGRISKILFVAISVVCVSLCSYAHSGRTDSSGGHKDNKNKSGLGSYHYHCGGNPPHLHTNGVCPYSSKSSTSSSSSNKNSSSSTTTVSAEPVTVKATKIEINEDIDIIYVGESKSLTATILPYNASNKNVRWKSSDTSVATVSSSGKVTAKKVGIVEITASTSNGKISTLKISVIEAEEEITEIEEVIDTNIIAVPTTNISNNSNINNAINTIDSSGESSTAGGVIALGLLGGGYWLYRKNKKFKKDSV